MQKEPAMHAGAGQALVALVALVSGRSAGFTA